MELTEEEKEILAKAREILRRMKSDKKSAAARENGKKGGRPRKQKVEEES